MTRLTDDADYDAGEMSGNVPSSRFDPGIYHAYYGHRTGYVPLGLPANIVKLRKPVQETSIYSQTCNRLIYLYMDT
ncbi:unnamed protein product [Protopolystoma xenopodis]|uniref:Uncharacterized protein n=1 Tax=Protopolystoma xenopodis TaxID=117903 RepID=A0A3S5AHW2_9PLAT|nr:unnamed protein product [Protopolystoma xenopodis]